MPDFDFVLCSGELSRHYTGGTAGPRAEFLEDDDTIVVHLDLGDYVCDSSAGLELQIRNHQYGGDDYCWPALFNYTYVQVQDIAEIAHCFQEQACDQVRRKILAKLNYRRSKKLRQQLGI